MAQFRGSGDSAEPFLLTLAFYVYHIHTSELPISALNLLALISRSFPLSLLACLGKDNHFMPSNSVSFKEETILIWGGNVLGDEADAVRDILTLRLEAKTEDPRVKVEWPDFVTRFFTNSTRIM